MLPTHVQRTDWPTETVTLAAAPVVSPHDTLTEGVSVLETTGSTTVMVPVMVVLNCGAKYENVPAVLKRKSKVPIVMGAPELKMPSATPLTPLTTLKVAAPFQYQRTVSPRRMVINCGVPGDIPR